MKIANQMVLFEPLDCFNVRDVATNRWRILTFQGGHQRKKTVRILGPVARKRNNCDFFNLKPHSSEQIRSQNKKIS